MGEVLCWGEVLCISPCCEEDEFPLEAELTVTVNSPGHQPLNRRQEENRDGSNTHVWHGLQDSTLARPAQPRCLPGQSFTRHLMS